MDLTKFKFAEVSAFSAFSTNKELLQEAKDRGFYNESTPYNRLFLKLFFDGGKVKFKKGLNEEFKSKAWKYCRSFMRSLEPKHQEKEAICAMIMSELLEPELETV